MNIKKISHIAIAVKDLEKAVELYSKKLGFEFEGIEEVPDQKVKTAFLKTKAGEHIELVAPLTEDSPITGFLEKKGEGLHHIAFEVDEEITNALNILSDNEIKLIDKSPRIGAKNKKIAFLHPKSTAGVLLEICQ